MSTTTSAPLSPAHPHVHAAGPLAKAARPAALNVEKEVRFAVVLYGGERVFAAGADIKEMESITYADMLGWPELAAAVGVAVAAFVLVAVAPARPLPVAL